MERHAPDGLVRVLGDDRVADLPVRGDHRAEDCRRVADARLLPVGDRGQGRPQRRQRPVAAGVRDEGVKLLVDAHELGAATRRGLQGTLVRAQRRHLAVLPVPGRLPGQRRLDDQPGVQHLPQRDVRHPQQQRQHPGQPVGVGPGDERPAARAHPDLDDALRLQHPQRLADGGPAHLVLGDHLRFGRQPVAGAQPPADDAVGDRLGKQRGHSRRRARQARKWRDQWRDHVSQDPTALRAILSIGEIATPGERRST
ncbi:MAG TPA: hypothetical protein VHZ03_49215 [Trebonia sp.]|nr:hypothetical protein [Trebonia sp.]